MPENAMEKRRKEGCCFVLLILITLPLASCFLSLLAHPVVTRLGVKGEMMAEVCLGRVSQIKDPVAIERQGF